MQKLTAFLASIMVMSASPGHASGPDKPLLECTGAGDARTCRISQGAFGRAARLSPSALETKLKAETPFVAVSHGYDGEVQRVYLFFAAKVPQAGQKSIDVSSMSYVDSSDYGSGDKMVEALGERHVTVVPDGTERRLTLAERGEAWVVEHTVGLAVRGAMNAASSVADYALPPTMRMVRGPGKIAMKVMKIGLILID